LLSQLFDLKVIQLNLLVLLLKLDSQYLEFMLQLLQLLVQFVGLLFELLFALLFVRFKGLELLFEPGLRIVSDVHGRLVVVAPLGSALGLLLLDHVCDLLALLLKQANLLMLKLQLLVVLSILILESLIHVLGLSHLVVKLV
jgi:hypothetical protein